MKGVQNTPPSDVINIYITMEGGAILKRRVFAWLLVIFLLADIAFTGAAVTPRAIIVNPGITFNQGIATCTVNVTANYTTDSIFVIVKLFDEDGNGVKTWVQSGSGFVNFSRTIEVTSGTEYTLRAYVTVNDESIPTASVTRTCP